MRLPYQIIINDITIENNITIGIGPDEGVNEDGIQKRSGRGGRVSISGGEINSETAFALRSYSHGKYVDLKAENLDIGIDCSLFMYFFENTNNGVCQENIDGNPNYNLEFSNLSLYSNSNRILTKTLQFEDNVAYLSNRTIKGYGPPASSIHRLVGDTYLDLLSGVEYPAYTDSKYQVQGGDQYFCDLDNYHNLFVDCDKSVLYYDEITSSINLRVNNPISEIQGDLFFNGDLMQSNIAYENSPVVNNPRIGTYCLTFQDCDICFTVEGETCNELKVLNSNITNSNCGDSDGGISIQLQSESPCGLVAYKWNSGEETQSISDLNPGTYCVTITDENCSDTDGNNCIVVKCFKVKSQNNSCHLGFCYSDIEINDEGSVTGLGYINVDGFSCEVEESYWSFNGSSISSAGAIGFPGQYCLHYIDNNKCLGEMCWDIGYCTNHNGKTCTIWCTRGPRKNETNIRRQLDELELDIVLYPNPFSDMIYFKESILIENIEIFSLDGRLVYQINNMQDGDSVLNKNKLDLNNLESGAFIMRIVQKNGIISRKKIVKL